jgi:hypothetical protein
MYYYFDESGNWQELEKDGNLLVMAGVLVKNKDILERLNNDINKFKEKNNISQIHITDIKNFQQKDELYKILDKYVTDEIRVLGYVIEPKNINQTQKEEDEIYLDIASQLISEITFGDKNIHIEYDMKFYYSYAPNVIENINKIVSYDDEFQRMQNKTQLIPFKIDKEKERVENLLKKYKIKKEITKQFLYKYIWSEFRLKVEKSYRIREILKDRILFYTQLKSQKLGITPYYPKISIKYQAKHKKVIGIEVADIFNNLIWREKKGINTPAGKKLFQKLNVKEIK